MKKVISIHQPNFIPWVPTLVKEACADIHVILDHVEYSKNGWTNRCEFTSSNDKKAYLTIPVSKSDTSLTIDKVKIGNDSRYYSKLEKTFASFGKSYPGNTLVRDIGLLIKNKQNETEKLVDINDAVSKFIRVVLGITTKTQRSSIDASLEEYQGADLVEKIFKSHEGKMYLTGTGGLKYLSSSFIINCKTITPKILNLEPDEINTIDFILKHGSNAKNRFSIIVDNFRKEIEGGM